MDVRIDEPGKDIFTGGVDHLCPWRDREIAINARNRLVLAEDIREVTFTGGDDLAIPDEEAHLLVR
jgi:hypothetical protein